MIARVLCCLVLLSLLTLGAANTATDPTTIELNPVALAPDPAKLHPVERVPRVQYGLVGAFPLDEKDLDSLVYPSTTLDERAALLEGLTFFTTPHTADEGLGPPANQRFCLGCHTNSDNVLSQERNVHLVPTISQASRAARSSPTNFSFTSFNPATGGGRAPDNVDAINNTGKTAAFTLFGDFKPTINAFNALATFSSGGVQRVRPALDACLPDRIPLVSEDPNLMGGVDPTTFLSASGFRRTTGERAAPPYIGRGLIEAVFAGDIIANVAAEQAPINTSLDAGSFPECGSTDCATGRANMNTSNQAFVGGHTDVRVGRLGLRAAGPTLTQFMIGGSQGELGFTSPLFPTEPFSFVNAMRPGCVSPPSVTSPNIPLSTIVSLRALVRLTAPPEFGKTLLLLLRSPNPGAPPPNGTPERMVQRGAELFGVDLVAFANRMIPGLMPAGGDGRDEHAINQADRKLNCVGCHTPVMATGQLPAETGAEHLNNAWVPLFTDLLVHKMTNINAERIAPTERLPLAVQRVDFQGRLANTLDLSRNLTDDTLPNQGFACTTVACLPVDRIPTSGDEWRTPPLMGLGRIGPPFLHDARVYLSKESVSTTPAGTVYSDADTTNSPLVVQRLEDAIRAAIELHDLPAPLDAPNQSTETGGGCPVPPGNRIGDVVYQNGATDICPPLQSPNRSQARKVMKRWRSLSDRDQQAVIEFLKQL